MGENNGIYNRYFLPLYHKMMVYISSIFAKNAKAAAIICGIPLAIIKCTP